jgi:hypothetical protein
MFDKLLDFVVSSVRREEQDKFAKINEKWDESRPVNLHEFWVDVLANDLIAPCRKKALAHRDREQVWTKKLEEAEKKLREEGVDLEVYDSATNIHNAYQMLSSGSISNAGQTFQPRVDQALLGAVKHAKNKMLDHRTKAEGYEKYARVFSLGRQRYVRLTADNIEYFGLETP